MVNRAAIVAAARAWLGTPFHHQARAKGVGCDCAGLIIGVGRELGLLPAGFDINGYPRTPDGVSLLQHCDEHMVPVSRQEMGLGDVIVIRWEKQPQHLGFIGDYRHGGLSMIHAMGSTGHKRGSVIEHRLDPTMLARFVAAYRLPGVA